MLDFQKPQTERNKVICDRYKKAKDKKGLQAQLAREYSITPERVRQILVKNKIKVKK